MHKLSQKICAHVKMWHLIFQMFTVSWYIIYCLALTLSRGREKR